MTRDDLKRVHGLLTDMDGVWFVGNTAVPGAVEALARLRARNLPMRFVTNTTTRTAAQLADKMRRLGLEVAAHEFVTTPAATVRYLREHGISSVHLAVANAIRAEFREFTGTGPPQAVVIGDVGGAWDHDLVQDLFRAIMDGAAIVAMHKKSVAMAFGPWTVVVDFEFIKSDFELIEDAGASSGRYLRSPR
jgi:HAD superfamily hydrolase (TIGR01450 family)